LVADRIYKIDMPFMCWRQKQMIAGMVSCSNNSWAGTL
jgi:hypothetical protein